MANANPKWFFYEQKQIIEKMSKKLGYMEGYMEVGSPYMTSETTDSEVIFSIHYPFKVHSELI